MSWDGTLHIGNLCNNNYKLCLALRHIGVDAHYVHFERLARSHPLSNPRHYDPDFDTTASWVHSVSERHARHPQMLYELSFLRRLLNKYSGRLWPHAQTDFPAYVTLLAKDYSAHSTGSDLRVEYDRPNWRGRLLRRGYRRARVAFFNNIDLCQHDVGRFTTQAFLPNALDPNRYVLGPQEDARRAPAKRLRLLLPSRITLESPVDIKGTTTFIEALHTLGDSSFAADLVVASEDPQVAALETALAPLTPKLRVFREPFRDDRQAYLRQVQAADVVIDQFGLGAMGGTALDCFAMGRIALVHTDPAAFESCYGGPSPLGALSTSGQIATMLAQLQDVHARQELEQRLQKWVLTHHAETQVAGAFLKRLATVSVDIGRTPVEVA